MRPTQTTNEAKNTSVPRMGKNYLQAAIYIGLIFFVVNLVAIGVFEISGPPLVVANILPTLFSVLIIFKALDVKFEF